MKEIMRLANLLPTIFRIQDINWLQVDWVGISWIKLKFVVKVLKVVVVEI